MAEQLNPQNWKLAAPGAGVIVFRPRYYPCPQGDVYDESMGAIDVLLSRRTAKVGKGYGITGGGFVECGALMQKPVGCISRAEAEAWREAVEENPGFEDIVPYDVFLERAQMLTSFAVRAADANGIHAASYLAFCATPAEYDAIASLPPSDEREGELVSVTLSVEQNVRRAHAGEDVQFEGKDAFFHAHELEAFGQMVWLAQRNKLWLE